MKDLLINFFAEIALSTVKALVNYLKQNLSAEKGQKGIKKTKKKNSGKYIKELLNYSRYQISIGFGGIVGSIIICLYLDIDRYWSQQEHKLFIKIFFLIISILLLICTIQEMFNVNKIRRDYINLL